MICNISKGNKSFKTIAVSFQNFQALQKRGKYGDRMDDIVTELLRQVDDTTTITSAGKDTSIIRATICEGDDRFDNLVDDKNATKRVVKPAGG
jgi:hypothetical protein